MAILLVLVFRSRPGFWNLLAKLVGERDYVITVRTPSGPARLVFNPLHTSELTVVDELLSGDVYIAKREASRFVDCGAFRGISTIYLQDQVKAVRVTAYEPQAENFAILARRLAKYLPAAVCVNAAVGPANGEVLFGGGGVGGSIGEVGNRVRMVRLRDELSAERPSTLLVKMDIEGAEHEVLPDILPVLPQDCSLFLETHFPLAPSRSLLEPFRREGFNVTECRSRKDSDSDVLFIDWELSRH
jgi:FkbM family methyltransferase